jgi:hypothetical protein
MRCSFQRPDRDGSTRRPVVKDQRKPASGPADPQIQTPAIRQPDMVHRDHAAIVTQCAEPAHPAVTPGERDLLPGVPVRPDWLPDDRFKIEIWL